MIWGLVGNRGRPVVNRLKEWRARGEKKRRLEEGLRGRIVEGSIDNLFIEE